jgi:ATP-dependent RNA circularization protein (DNA/RNA ligase family)
VEYPKIETAFDRDLQTFKVVPGKVRRPEFGLPRRWLVTEKIDGTNVRVTIDTGGEVDPEGNVAPARVCFQGRTDKAQLPPFLAERLREMFPLPLVAQAFEPMTTAVLFGEGYGARIQKGGGNYREGVSFRLFDVVVFGREGRPWWLNWKDMKDIAWKLGIQAVPVVGEAEEFWYAAGLASGPSLVAQEDGGNPETQREGVVCRTDPLLFMRDGRPLMWKLKEKDFPC